jgi:hypothetical protein
MVGSDSDWIMHADLEGIQYVYATTRHTIYILHTQTETSIFCLFVAPCPTTTAERSRRLDNSRKKQKTGCGRPSNAVNFCGEEDIALCKAYVNVTTCPIHGADKKSSVFWADVKIRFDQILNEEIDEGRLKLLPDCLRKL